jgi:hypothetical protein
MSFLAQVRRKRAAEEAGEPEVKSEAKSARVVFDAETRRAVERERLVRVVDAISREPTAGERQRLRALAKRVQPKARANEFWLGTSAVELTDANKDKLDLAGYGSLQPEGVPCQMARVTIAAAPARASALEELVAEEATVDRHDAMLFVTEDNRVRAVDRVLVQQENKQLMLHGRLVLRKIKLSEEERLRINSAHNVLERDYLDYYTYADDKADDPRSAEHQRQYDKYYELLYAVSDCLLIHVRQVNNNYLQRITLVHNLTEMPLAQHTTMSFRKRMESINRAVAFAGGLDRLRLTIFLQPVWSVKHIRAAMHAVPACLQGTAIDGVVFTPNDAAYEFGSNARLLHYPARRAALTEDALLDYIVERQRATVE